MKKWMLACVVAVWACSGSEAKKEAAAPPAPPALKAADLSGTFRGTTMMATSDSVTATWTSTVTVDSAGVAHGKLVAVATPKDTVSFTQRIEGDSTISESAPYTDRAMPKGSPQVRWKAVGHANGNEWTGTVDVMAVGKDSIIARMRWKSTRTP